MQTAVQLAGFFAAHAVWCISDGEILIPLLGYDTADGTRGMKRLVADRVEEGAARGQEWLDRNPDAVARAALIVDGYVTLATGNTDALIITVRDYTQGDAQITIAVPYRSAKDPRGFAVHRPKFLGYTGSEPDWQRVGEALWIGIDKHEKGCEVWNKHLDEGR